MLCEIQGAEFPPRLPSRVFLLPLAWPEGPFPHSAQLGQQTQAGLSPFFCDAQLCELWGPQKGSIGGQAPQALGEEVALGLGTAVQGLELLGVAGG